MLGACPLEHLVPHFVYGLKDKNIKLKVHLYFSLQCWLCITPELGECSYLSLMNHHKDSLVFYISGVRLCSSTYFQCLLFMWNTVANMRVINNSSPKQWIGNHSSSQPYISWSLETFIKDLLLNQQLQPYLRSLGYINFIECLLMFVSPSSQTLPYCEVSFLICQVG